MSNGIILYENNRFKFKGSFRESWAHVRIYKYKAITVAIVSEVLSADGDFASAGMSSINAIEDVATRLRNMHYFDILVSHIPDRRAARGANDPLWAESYAKVVCTWENRQCVDATFLNIDKEQIEDWIKISIPDIPYQLKDIVDTDD